MFKLRYYQDEAITCAIAWVRKNSDPCLINIPTGGGKSIIVAKIAQALFTMSKGKRVLCLAPSKELVEQNHAKYLAIGEKASIYSASVGRKELREQVVFATEGTFKKIAKSRGHEFCAVIADESHKISNTFNNIIKDMQESNPRLRVIGLTATPYRLGMGYIYELDEKNRKVQETVNPYYKKLIYSISAQELIDHGFLTPPLVGDITERYDTSNIKLHGTTFKQDELDQAFVGKGRLTSHIVADIVARSYDRKAVLIFGATIAHAYEILESLPPEKSAILHGGLTTKERTQTISEFKSGKLKYLVNVGILTTGFDYPELDVIAILRPTESAGLYQQIVGRGTRLADGKESFLLLDYTDNIENFFGNSSNIFEPTIKAYGKKPSVKIEVECPQCAMLQEFSKRVGYEVWDKNGYAVDEFGDRLADNMPAHHGRRCTNVTPIGKNEYKRCDYYWTHKECPKCQHKNDIAARFCEECKHELIDPNKKLKEIVSSNIVKNEVAIVRGMTVKETTTQSGDLRIMAWFDTDGEKIHASFFPDHHNKWVAKQGQKFQQLNGEIPKEIIYSKSSKGFTTIHEYVL